MHRRLQIIVLLVLAVFSYSYFQKNKIESMKVSENVSILRELPLAKFRTLDGEEVSLASNSKNKTFIHFWATWCGPCEEEFPQLLGMVRLNKSQTKFYLVAVNDELKDIKRFLEKYGATDLIDKIFMDQDQVHQKMFGIYKMPETYIFDESGKVEKRLSGPQDWDNFTF